MCNASAILEGSGMLNLLMNLNRVPLIVLGFFDFHFPIDFIGGQLTGGQCLAETPYFFLQDFLNIFYRCHNNK